MVIADTSESKLDSGGGAVAVGDYHWMIEEVEAIDGDFGTSVRIVASVLAGRPRDMNEGNQVGKRHTEYFQCSGKAVDRLRRLLVATHLITDDWWRERIGQPIEFDETQLKSRQFCARIKLAEYRGKNEDYKGKKFPQMGFDIWSPLDPRAKDIPKDQEVLAMNPPPPGHQRQPQSSSAQQQSDTTAGASGNDFGW